MWPASRVLGSKKFLKFLLFPAITLLLAGCDARVEEGAGQAAQVTEEAAELNSSCEPVIFEEAPLTHCTADPAHHAISLVQSDLNDQPYRSFAAYAATRPADAAPVAFAVNAGMYDEGGRAIGYYVENGERLKRLNRAQGPGNFHMLPNGVFFGGKQKDWRVWNTERFYENVSNRPDFGTQSGPMLVIEGELHPDIDPNGESLRVRKGVGVDTAGRAHFVISEQPVSFGALARYFRDVIGAPNALYLDGTVSQLWDPVRGRMDNGPAIGPMIIVEIDENDA